MDYALNTDGITKIYGKHTVVRYIRLYRQKWCGENNIYENCGRTCGARSGEHGAVWLRRPGNAAAAYRDID